MACHLMFLLSICYPGPVTTGSPTTATTVQVPSTDGSEYTFGKLYDMYMLSVEI